MRDSEYRRLKDLHWALVDLANHQGVKVQETVETIKAGILANGADPEIVAGFFAYLDAVASLHIN